MKQSEVVRSDRTVEYLIFSNSRAYLSSSAESDCKIAIKLCDCQNDMVFVEPEDDKTTPHDLEIFKNKDLVFRAGFKGRSFTFKTSIVEWSQNTNNSGKTMFSLSLPAQAHLIDMRTHPRLSLFSDFESLRAEVEIASHTKRDTSTFNVSKFVDISQQAISLFVDRKQGLILPNDVVYRFRLYNGSQIIMESEGIIHRIERSRKLHENTRLYFVVILLKQKSLNSNLDCEGKDPNDKRRIDRLTLISHEGNYVSFKHPLFTSEQLIGQIIDVSSSGLSFLIDATRLPIHPGLVLSSLEIQLLKKHRFYSNFQITSVQEVSDGNTTTLRVGGKFLGISVNLIKRISEAMQEIVDPNISDAKTLDNEQLWEFFFQTGFIYSDKRRQLQENAAKIYATYSRLLKQDTSILKKIVYKEQDEIRGHVSAIKYFDTSWLVQHLNASKTTNRKLGAQLVMQAMIPFFIDARSNKFINTNYILAFYRPNNLYASMLFTEVANIVDNSQICGYSDLGFCLMKHEHNGPLSQRFDARRAMPEDFDILETLLLDQNYFMLIKTENLIIEKFETLDISKEYEELELYRRREIYCVEDPDTYNKAFAICNFASPGLNLSEITNSFRLFFTDPDCPSNLDLANSLCDTVIQAYKSTDMPSAVLLREQDGILPDQFIETKIYRYWYFNTDEIKKFQSAFNKIYSNLKFYLKEYSKE